VALWLQPVEPVGTDFMPQEPEHPGPGNATRTAGGAAIVTGGGVASAFAADPAGSVQTVVAVKSGMAELLAGLPLSRLAIPLLIIAAVVAVVLYARSR
jgi:hypothetical protein